MPYMEKISKLSNYLIIELNTFSADLQTTTITFFFKLRRSFCPKCHDYFICISYHNLATLIIQASR